MVRRESEYWCCDLVEMSTVWLMLKLEIHSPELAMVHTSLEQLPAVYLEHAVNTRPRFSTSHKSAELLSTRRILILKVGR